jgi:glycosyltransferase involved in cell wall biosynthesis
MISVIVPYKEDRGYLHNCIDSIRGQSYTDYELLLCKSEGSLPVNFNSGLKRAKGEFIKMVQDDDWLPVDGLKYLIENIGTSPWIIGNVWQMCDNPYIHKPPYLDFASQVVKYDMHMGSTLYRTDVLREIGGMDETLLTGEEYDMHLKLLYLGYNPAYIDKEVYHYRMWSGGKSVIFRKHNKEWRQNELKKIQTRYLDKIQHKRGR